MDAKCVRDNHRLDLVLIAAGLRREERPVPKVFIMT
jgi:hypothetical protein